MREMGGTVLVYESLLTLYYDENAKVYLDQEMRGIIDSFVGYCKAKDIVDNTRIAETMCVVYNPKNNKPKSELKKTLTLSGSSLYRVRIKLIHSLSKYVSDKLNGK